MFEQLNSLAFISMPGGWEWIIVAFIGLLLFGKRLPDVGKSLGKSIVEFKKGLKGMEDDINRAVNDEGQKDMLPPPDPSEHEAHATHETAHTANSDDPADASPKPASGSADV